MRIPYHLKDSLHLSHLLFTVWFKDEILLPRVTLTATNIKKQTCQLLIIFYLSSDYDKWEQGQSISFK